MGLLTYLLATICLVFASHRCQAQSTWRTIDSGVTTHNDTEYGNRLVLYSGDKIMILNAGRGYAVLRRNFYEDNPIYPGFIPHDFEVQASVMTHNTALCMHYGKTFGYFEVEMSTSSPKKFQYGPNRAFLQNGGPDAAARRFGKTYLFKGCMMAERKKWYSWGKPQNVSVTMGLPCDVDAAWLEKDGVMAVLKGPQIWRWQADGSTSGPVPMSDNYELADWDLYVMEKGS